MASICRPPLHGWVHAGYKSAPYVLLLCRWPCNGVEAPQRTNHDGKPPHAPLWAGRALWLRTCFFSPPFCCHPGVAEPMLSHPVLLGEPHIIFFPLVNHITCRVQNPDTQRAGRVGTAQGGRRSGETLGKTRCRHFGGLGTQPPLWPSGALSKTVLNVFSQARTKEILCKPVEEQNLRFTRGLSAVYQWGRKRSSLLAVDQCTDAYLSL